MEFEFIIFRGDAYTESLKKEFLSSLRSITFERTPRFGFISNPKKEERSTKRGKIVFQGSLRGQSENGGW